MTDLVSQLVAQLEDMRGKVIELCQTYGNALPHGSLERTDAALTAAKAGGWLPIETAPVGREMFAVIGVTSGNGFTAGRPYTTDPYCVWQPHKSEFSRWPHGWAPTHWHPLPTPPREQSAGGLSSLDDGA